jgi:hypothetical protein
MTAIWALAGFVPVTMRPLVMENYSSFSKADPLEAALGELANVEFHDRLPTPKS